MLKNATAIYGPVKTWCHRTQELRAAETERARETRGGGLRTGSGTYCREHHYVIDPLVKPKNPVVACLKVFCALDLQCRQRNSSCLTRVYIHSIASLSSMRGKLHCQEAENSRRKRCVLVVELRRSTNLNPSAIRFTGRTFGKLLFIMQGED
ncbi:hypothetical protein RRG08_034748 [Elysia crispata]|uniref:Uncharacterized protein n=1 Tax=Elysia crispata TaxID=231223 RepID=A0AAE1CR93_9GAST|nr:hypothetical protein RRG08_034748 [Elysia crispata]